ncbi:MAG: DNA polymerase III subunit alpha [Dongiaceae bacterium]
MSHADFVHLRVHSAYSLSEGALKIKQLVELCRRHAMPALAITDSGNLFGGLEFALAARDAGIQPIIGCQFNITRRDGGEGAVARPGVKPKPDHLVLLVQDETGYRNLMELSSRAFLEGEPGNDPQLPLAALAGSTDGLIALAGGPSGTVGRLLADGQASAAEAALGELETLFPGRLYVELMRHGGAAERRIEEPLLDLAYRRNLPLVATNDVYFSDTGMYEAHDALLCIAGGAYVSQEVRRRETPEHRFKSAEEMRALFADLPEAIDNTLVIAQRCAYMPEARKPILPPFVGPNGEPAEEELRRQATEGLELRLEALQRIAPLGDEEAREARAKPYRQRLGFELETIIAMGFAGYFLIVADFIQWAKREGIPVGPGRGSGAGSVVAWALTITDLDPLRWGLLFERFLNPERVSMPDFDIDFCQDRRDEVIRYVQGRYGRDRVAQIITFGKLQARAALRDVGRVLQMPYGQVDRICKMVPNNPANPVTISQAVSGEPMLRHMQDEDPQVKRLIEVATSLEGLYRHASTHAAGVVIGDRPLAELVPLYRDPRSDMPVTQFNMKYVEQAGLVKFDFLGLKTLTVLVRAAELLAERGIAVDLSSLPLDDPKAYAQMGRAETMGVFQLEGSGMRDVLRRLKPDRFEDIIAVVALYRPGPMDNIPRYIACKHGQEEPDYLHPALEGILKETFGIMVYQEQVMQIAQELSGFTLGGADLLRRAMGKKIKAEMEAQRKSFIDGAAARGVPPAKAEQIFEQVDKFAGYGFNKSHAAAYALVAYQTAWFKANHPVEFFAASMTYDLGNTDRLNMYRQELERLQIRLLPPDINRSRSGFTVEKDAEGKLAIRYALAAVRNVGAGAIDALVAEREANGPFEDLGDIARRIDHRHLNKRQLENLAAAGAFDRLMANRRRVFEGVEQLIRHASVAAEERTSQQVSLFGNGLAEPARLQLPEVPDWPSIERLQHEYAAIGFYLSAHPLDAYETTLKRLEAIPYGEIARWLQGRSSNRVKLAGIVVGKQERTSAKGNRFAFLQLTDASGMYEVMVFSEALAAHRDLMEPGKMVLLSVAADLRSEAEGMRVTLQSIQSLDQAAAQAAVGLRVFIKDPAPIDSLKKLLQLNGRGRSKVSLVLELAPAREVELSLKESYALSAPARAAIKAIPGIVDVQEI